MHWLSNSTEMNGRSRWTPGGTGSNWSRLEATSDTAARRQRRGRDTASDHAGDGGGAVKIPKLPSNASSSASARPLDLCPGIASSPKHLAVSSKSRGGEEGWGGWGLGREEGCGWGGGWHLFADRRHLRYCKKKDACLVGRLREQGFDAYARSTVAASRVERCSLPPRRCVCVPQADSALTLPAGFMTAFRSLPFAQPAASAPRAFKHRSVWPGRTSSVPVSPSRLLLHPFHPSRAQPPPLCPPTT